jgi:hypothetical protein
MDSAASEVGMELEKGMIVELEGIWYVVVLVRYDSVRGKTILYCICDNANNTYSWDVGEIDGYLTLE